MAFNAKISPLQLYTTRNFAGLTESNHLSNAYMTEPAKVGAVLAYAFGTDYRYTNGNNSILSLLTGGIGNAMEIDNREYSWYLHGQNDRAIEVVANYSDGGATPGLSGSTFRVKFAEKWFSVTDLLFADDQTQVRVKEEPYQEGNGWVYTLELATSDFSAFIDPTMIAAGARFSKGFSPVEEYSAKGGSTNYATPFMLRNQLTTLRKQYEVTRSAATDVLVMELYDPSDPGKKTKLWVKLAEWVAMAQWYKELDYAYIYSEYNKNTQGYVNLKGENGRPVYIGAGLRQQIAPANVRYYNRLTYNILDEFLLDLSYQASKWGGDTKFVALTGKMGMREFSRAITEYFNGTAPNITITNNSGQFIGGKGNELVFEGNQWITAKFPNGVELTVKEFPVYDDIVKNRVLHPISKKPIESYRFTIMNFGTKNGQANIKKMDKKGSGMAMWHIAGSTDPMAGVAKSINTMRSSGIDGYQVHFLAETGLMLQDPTSCGELIFSLDA
jgi:hypothetical protein